MLYNTAHTCADDAEILSYEVSTDGVNWRPHDPSIDPGPGVHRRIEFAPPNED
ncbi:hypothetical protein U91I_00706 [alpha proteobacterium U9-1i]|nr:hypothetical protein U91I_00706 [alpha proteobacterium U9-1i]